MDYSNLTVVELTSVVNLLNNLEGILEDHYPENVWDMVEEYLSMSPEEKATILNEMSVKANFMAYAESVGNTGMADALIKVADEMAGLDSEQLKAVEENGIQAIN